MLLCLLLLAQAASPPDGDIVVRGERLKRLRFSAQVDKRGRVACRLKQSSGDAAIDALPCAAVGDCAPRRLATRSAVEACVRERLAVRFTALTGAPLP